MGKKDEGILLVVSGPSGAGKGTICNEIRNIYPELNYSISMTPKKSVLDLIERGKSVLLEIDIQGAMQVKERYPKGVFIYIVPPSLRTLSARLHGRGTDSEDTIQKRLAQITGELSMAHKYDYIVVNDVLKDAVHKTCAIIEAERCKLSRNQNQIETIFQQYINKEVPLK